MAFTLTDAHNAVAGVGKADYVFNVNLPSWKPAPTEETAPKKAVKSIDTIYILAGVLVVLVFGIVIVSRRRQNA